MRVMIHRSRHFTVRQGKSVPVDTYTAFHKPRVPFDSKGNAVVSTAIAHNYSTEREARQALNTFRYAYHQQG